MALTSAKTLRRATVGETSRYLPPASLECLYFVQVFYSIMAEALGISISLLGLAMLVVIGGACVMRMGRHSIGILRPISAILACGVSFVAVQILVHGESVMGGAVREFIPWMLGLVVVQWLALRRGFLHRFAIVALLIGLSTLPFLKSFSNDLSRVGLVRGITISNPNDLGAWFGFCCVYFAILGLEAQRVWLRLIAVTVAVGCLLVVGLTVSRSSLLATAVGIVLGGRRVLKHGFLPVVSAIVVAWGAYGLGLFERAAGMYGQRGLEETGRLLVWPLAIQRFLASPFAGVGAGHVQTYVPGDGLLAITPHNGFVFIALAAGVVPLLFFVIYWMQLIASTIWGRTGWHEDHPFHAPLLAYSFLIINSTNAAFMVPWAMATLATITTAGLLSEPRAAITGVIDRRRVPGRRNPPMFVGRTTG
jgi:O-antigen ligase